MHQEYMSTADVDQLIDVLGISVSRLRQQYQLPIDAYGFHGSAIARNSACDVDFSRQYSLRIPFRTPRSSTGKTFRRPSENIRNISAVQRPIPRTRISDPMISSSENRPIVESRISPDSTLSARSSMYSAFRCEQPALRNGSTPNPRRHAGVTRFEPESDSTRATTRSRTVRAAAVEICCEMIDRTSIQNRSRSHFRVQGPTWPMTCRITGSTFRRCRTACLSRSDLVRTFATKQLRSAFSGSIINNHEEEIHKQTVDSCIFLFRGCVRSLGILYAPEFVRRSLTYF